MEFYLVTFKENYTSQLFLLNAYVKIYPEKVIQKQTERLHMNKIIQKIDYKYTYTTQKRKQSHMWVKVEL